MDNAALPSALLTLSANVQRFKQTSNQRRCPFEFPDGPLPTKVALPADHFLSQPIESLARSERPQFLGGRLDTSSLGAADFDVDVASGFLPPDEPIRRLSGMFEIWEHFWELSACVGLADNSAAAMRWRQQINDMPIVKTESLKTLPYLRRAHVVLAFLTHRYVHSMELEAGVKPVIPAGLSEPFLAVSERLDVPPILTYADTVLWNWKFANPDRGLRADNIQMVNTFTGTTDEAHFYFSSFLIELGGVSALRLMANSLDEAFINDALAQSRIATYLFALAHCIDDLTEAMKSVQTDCAPIIFYNDIRPWFNGGKWIHTQSTTLTEKDFGGPSAGQSSLIHALDVFLTIDHSDRPEINHLTKDTIETLQHNATFMTRMSLYMPHHHRHFLRHLAQQIPSIRDIALQAEKQSPLADAYNGAIHAMRRFREAHTWIVGKYIIAPSRAIAANSNEAALLGTGGTNVVAFLKRTRERTIEAILP